MLPLRARPPTNATRRLIKDKGGWVLAACRGGCCAVAYQFAQRGSGGAPTVLLDELTFPGGFAIGPDDAAYITNFGTSATDGEVLRLPLSSC